MISPRGDRIAFLDHPVRNDDGGTVAVVDLKGNSRTLSEVFESIQGLAWSAGGGEVWFTGAVIGTRDLYPVTLSGRERVRARLAGSLTLDDIFRDGRALLLRETWRVGTYGVSSSGQTERDLSWFDWSISRDLSPDGKTLLFGEEGEGGGVGYSATFDRRMGLPRSDSAKEPLRASRPMANGH